jgi:hypothetical protein
LEIFLRDPDVFAAARTFKLYAPLMRGDLVIRDTEELLATSTPDVHSRRPPVLKQKSQTLIFKPWLDKPEPKRLRLSATVTMPVSVTLFVLF